MMTNILRFIQNCETTGYSELKLAEREVEMHLLQNVGKHFRLI